MRYQVSFDERAQHRAAVEMTISGANGPVELWMPVWTPGAYELRTWGRNVTLLSAVDSGGRALAFSRTGPSRFRVEGGSGAMRVRYRVYAARLTDDGSQVDGSHALLNGSSMFLAARGQEQGLHEVQLTLPAGWRSATALEANPAGWQASGYEALIDAPIECGRFVEARARAAGRNYRIIVDGVDGAAALPARLGDDVARIVEAEAHLAGAPPYRGYVIIVHLADEAGRVAALEHQASTSIIVPRRALVDTEGYDELLYVVAHELFHAWNAKRLRPAEMVPYDLSRAQPSRALWITEGLTEYFAHRAMLGAGRWSRSEYLQHVGEEAARAVQAVRAGGTLEEAAEQTWQPPDEAADDTDAYYARGHLVALALDAAMHVASNGKHGLDEALRALLAEADRAGGILPVDTAALARAIDTLTPGVGDKALAWARARDETERLGEALETIGLKLTTTTTMTRAIAGFSAERDGSTLRVSNVVDGGPAALAGLRGGDRVLQLDGAPPPLRWVDALAKKSAGGVTVLTVARGARMLELRVTLTSAVDVSCKLTIKAATPAVTRLRDAFLKP